MLLLPFYFYGVCLTVGLLGRTFIWATSDINPYKDIQKILSEDFNPHVPKPEMSVIPWKMNYSFDNKKILEFKDKSVQSRQFNVFRNFPLTRCVPVRSKVCSSNHNSSEVDERESSILFGGGPV